MPVPTSFTSDAWAGGLVPEIPASAGRLVVRRGVVLVGAEHDVFMLRAGEEHFASRALPDGLGPICSLSIEPRRRPRLAIGTPRAVVLLDGDALGKRRLGPSASPLEELAWGPRSGGSALYEMSEDGAFTRHLPETGEVEEIPLELCVAMTSGDDGLLAVASIDPDSRAVWTTRDGETWAYRVLPELDEMGVEGFAVSGEAAAISLGGHEAVFVSRGRDAPFTRCPALDGATVLAFEGDGPSAPLLGAVHPELTSAIVRVEADGTAARVVTIETPPGTPEPFVTALAWDESRGALWASIDGIGLLRTARKRAGGRQLS